MFYLYMTIEQFMQFNDNFYKAETPRRMVSRKRHLAPESLFHHVTISGAFSTTIDSIIRRRIGGGDGGNNYRRDRNR